MMMTAMTMDRTTITAIIPAKWGNTKQQSTKKSSYPRKNHIIVLGVLSSITPMHRHGTKGLMWGARGPFLPVVTMGVMLVVGSWSLWHVSTVRIVHLLRNLVGRHWTYLNASVICRATCGAYGSFSFGLLGVYQCIMSESQMTRKVRLFSGIPPKHTWTMWIIGPGIDINMIDFCQYNRLSCVELARGLGTRSPRSQDC